MNPSEKLIGLQVPCTRTINLTYHSHAVGNEVDKFTSHLLFSLSDHFHRNVVCYFIIYQLTCFNHAGQIKMKYFQLKCEKLSSSKSAFFIYPIFFQYAFSFPICMTVLFSNEVSVHRRRFSLQTNHFKRRTASSRLVYRTTYIYTLYIYSYYIYNMNVPAVLLREKTQQDDQFWRGSKIYLSTIFGNT